jgi:hypothetical protein
VAYAADQIVSHVIALVNKKNKNSGVKNHQVKNHLWIFVNALIDNPAFDSQTKETLTSRQSSFGSKCELSPEFLKKGEDQVFLLNELGPGLPFFMNQSHLLPSWCGLTLVCALQLQSVVLSTTFSALLNLSKART